MDNMDTKELDREMSRTKSDIFVMSNSAFYAPLMCSLNIIWDPTCETAWTDGVSIGWNPEFFLASSREFREAVMVHELDHVARLHMLRRGGRNMGRWNAACDFRINNDMVSGRHAKRYSFEDFPALIDHSLDIDGLMSEEAIYDLLPEVPPKTGWGGSGDGMGELREPTDTIAKQTAVANVITACHQARMSGNPGAIPGNIEQMIQDFLKPVIPWQRLLRRFFEDLIEEDYTWARPSRRYTDMYLPSVQQDEGRLDHLIYYIDVSGSISDHDAKRFLSECKHVWEVIKPKKMTLVQFDVQIHQVDELKDGDLFQRIKIIGRGGTSLHCVRQHIMEHKPTAAVIFSDLFCDPMNKYDIKIPIVWVVVNNPRAYVPRGDSFIHCKE